MLHTPINAPATPAPAGGYAQTALAADAAEWLLVSGQIPQTGDGVVPTTFEDQADLAWATVMARAQASASGVTSGVTSWTRSWTGSPGRPASSLIRRINTTRRA